MHVFLVLYFPMLEDGVPLKMIFHILYIALTREAAEQWIKDNTIGSYRDYYEIRQLKIGVALNR